MNKKAKATPAEKKPEPLLDTALTRELEGLEKLTGRAVKGEELKVTDDAVTALTLTRALLRDVEAAKKATVDTYLAPVKDQLDRVTLEAKTLKGRAERLEATLAGAIYEAIKAGRITDKVEASTGCTLTLAKRKEVQVTDEAALPEAFTKRVPDLKAIEAALNEWQVKAEAAKVLGLPPPACPVPGAQLGEKIVLMTKAPELIED